MFRFPCKQSSGTLVKENTLKIFYLLFKQFCITVCCIFIWSECVRRQFGCSLHLQNIFCLVSIKLWKCFLKKGKCLEYTVNIKRNASFTITSTLFSNMPFHLEQILSCFLDLAITSVRYLANVKMAICIPIVSPFFLRLLNDFYCCKLLSKNI